MADPSDIVVTGLGVVSPIGIGRDDFWSSLEVGRCGIVRLNEPNNAFTPLLIGAPLRDFDAKQYVTPRKALKVMIQELQTAYAASRLAWLDAGLRDGHANPERTGVIFGADSLTSDPADLADVVRACSHHGQMNTESWGTVFGKHITPLWMLKSLPNMPACHVGIAIDARGPNNTIVMEEVSGLLALQEAAMTIQRGAADMMVVGSTGSRIVPSRLVYRHKGSCDTSHDQEDPYCMPYDKRRRGTVPGEGAGAIVIESQAHAASRGARPIARLAGWASGFHRPLTQYGGSSLAVTGVVQKALKHASIESHQLAHISGQAFSHPTLDIVEAQGLRPVIDDVPVTGLSSYIGQLGGGCGIVELVASLLALSKGVILPTLGYHEPDQQIPLNVLTSSQCIDEKRYALKLNFTPHGQAAAVVIECLS